MADDKRSPTVVRLPVRIRRTWTSEHYERSLLVSCPEQRTSRSVERCRECVRCHGLGMDETGISHVLCETSVVERARKIMPTAAEVTPVSALMQREVVCLAPSLTRVEANKLLLERRLDAAPVVDHEGRPLGMITLADLLRGDGSAAAPPPSVSQLMSRVADTLDENDPVSRAAALMAAGAVRELAVLGDYGRVVGVVAAGDLVRWLARQSGYDV